MEACEIYALTFFRNACGPASAALMAKLKDMATENQKTIIEENSSESPSDQELFAAEVHEEASERQVFAGDEDSYKSLTDSSQAATTQTPARTSRLPTSHKRFSITQKVLAVSIVLIAAMLVYALLKPLSGPVTRSVQTPPEQIAPPVQQTPNPKPIVSDDTHVVQKQIQEPEPAIAPTQPLSLEVAKSFYLQKDYDNAYAVYNQLHQRLAKNAEEELLNDFLLLKMALCMEKTADLEQASRLFRKTAKSRSPVVSVVANYRRSLLDMQKTKYLNARTRAYQVISLIDAVNYDRDWALSLKRDCYFLAAEAVTRNVLLLCDADKELPQDLWPHSSLMDPFTGLNETQLRRLLNTGSEQLNKALLGPQIQKLQQSTPARWSVICDGASIEELLARFAANAGFDIHWALGFDETGIRKRAVSLYLSSATTQQFVTAATGYAGLLASIDEKGIVTIFNPAQYSSLSEHTSMLSTEAISLWQKFLLEFHDDKRLPNAHFALGLLQAQKGQVAESMAEYKLVGNRFSRSPLAPSALLNSSKLKAKMLDYAGARQDLKQLVEQYPDSEITNEAYLYLADTTANAGLKTEAARLYKKVFNLSWSLESQNAAALGAGSCFYQTKDHQAAEKWLTRYIGLAKDHKSKDWYRAYLLLGKINLALGNSEAACDALQYALTAPPEQLSRKEYAESVSALIEGLMEQQRYVEALDVSENIYFWQLTEQDSIEILLLKSRIYRAMGLLDKAIALLETKIDYIADPQLKAKISFELTDCYIAKGDLELARKKLTEIIAIIKSGPLAHEIALKLADVCLKLEKEPQAIFVCSQLLDLEPPEQIKLKALDLLATAYNQQKNYDRAALALLGQWK